MHKTYLYFINIFDMTEVKKIKKNKNNTQKFIYTGTECLYTNKRNKNIFF